MYRIMICDDNNEQLKIVFDFVALYIKEYPNRFYSPTIFHHPLDFLVTAENKIIFDVLLLDIFMPEMSGIELAKDRRLHNDNSQIIFITTTRDFAVEAIALNSTYYLVKPYTYEELKEALNRAYQNLEEKNIRMIALKSRDGGIYKINSSDIISVECFGHIQKVYCLKLQFEMRDAIETLTNEVFDNRFFSVYRGVYVNMEHIDFVGTSFVKTCDGRTLTIAKRIIPEFKKKYLDYMVRR